MKNNNLKSHCKSDKIKWIITGVAFFLVLVILAGLCLQLFGTGKVKPTEWFKNSETQTSEVEDSDGSLLVSDTHNSSFMTLSSKQVSVCDLTSGELSTLSAMSSSADTTVFRLEAHVTNEDLATYPKLECSVSWLGGDFGESIEDFVTVYYHGESDVTTPFNNYISLFIVEDFPHTIQVKVYCVDKPDINSSFKIDRVSTSPVTLVDDSGSDAPTFIIGGKNTLHLSYTNKGTVTPEISIESIYFKYSFKKLVNYFLTDNSNYPSWVSLQNKLAQKGYQQFTDNSFLGSDRGVNLNGNELTVCFDVGEDLSFDFDICKLFFFIKANGEGEYYLNEVGGIDSFKSDLFNCFYVYFSTHSDIFLRHSTVNGSANNSCQFSYHLNYNGESVPFKYSSLMPGESITNRCVVLANFKMNPDLYIAPNGINSLPDIVFTYDKYN